MHESTKELNTRSAIFGFEDGLVSTVGLLSGIAVAGVDSSTIILTGFVLIFVEAVSMGIGSFLSEETIEESRHSKFALVNSRTSGLIMFVAYIVAGLIPLLPYLFGNSPARITQSIIIAIISLFLLGVVSAREIKINLLKSGIRMVLLGGLAIGIGMLVGQLVGNLN